MIESKFPTDGELQFGPFWLNVDARILRCRGDVVPLKPKEAELLVLLVRAHPGTVSKDAIVEALWPDAVASDAAISQTVYRLRRALAERDASSYCIRTVPGFGFQFVRPLDDATNDGVPIDSSSRVFRYFRRGMFHLREDSGASILASIAFLREAQACDPRCVPVANALAQAYTAAGIRLLIDPSEAYARARRALSTVLDSQPRSASAETFASLSMLSLFFDGDYEAAGSHAEHALLLEPRSIAVQIAVLWERLAQKDFAGALAQADRALRLNPPSTHLTTMLGIVLYMSQRYDEAHEQFAEALSFDPFYFPALFYDSCSYAAHGKYDRALGRIEEIPDVDLSPRVTAIKGYIATKRGDTTQSRAAIDVLRTSSIYSAAAAVHIARGELEFAAELLVRALRAQEPGLFLTAVDPMYQPLRDSHPSVFDTIAHRSRP
jgi:DNA-binding winged helix-turn-helix (wHTH) protein/Tfp pilus assembly protein PilF